jgi:hypothetical protein
LDCYYWQCIHGEESKTCHSFIITDEICHFIALLIQMGHDRHMMKGYWLTNKPYYTPLYLEIMKCDQFLHILRFLHFKNNDNPPDRTTAVYDRLWKIRKMFDYISNIISALYYPTENLVVDEVILKFKEE